MPGRAGPARGALALALALAAALVPATGAVVVQAGAGPEGYSCLPKGCSDDADRQCDSKVLADCLREVAGHERPVLLLQGNYTLGSTIRVGEGFEPSRGVILRGFGDAPAELRCSQLLISGFPAITLHDNATMTLESLVVSGCGDSMNGGLHGSASVALEGSHAAFLLDHGAEIRGSRWDAVALVGVGDGYDVINQTVIMNNSARITHAQRFGVFAVACNGARVILDRRAAITSTMSGLHALFSKGLQLRFAGEAELGMMKLNGVSISGCRATEVLMDIGSQIHHTGDDGIHALHSEVGISLANGSFISQAGRSGIRVSGNMAGNNYVRIRSASILDCASNGVELAAHSSGVEVTVDHLSLISWNKGHGVLVAGTHHHCVISGGSTIEHSRIDGFSASGDNVTLMLEGATFFGNAGAHVRCIGSNASLYARDSVFKGGVLGFLLEKMLIVNLSGVEIVSVFGMGFVMSGKHLLTNDMLVSHGGVGFMLHEVAKWEGSGVVISQTNLGIVFNARVHVSLKNLRVLGNSWGMRCRWPPTGRITGEVYFNADIDFDLRCPRNGLQIVSSTVWLASYTRLAFFIRGVLLIGVGGSFMSPIVLVQPASESLAARPYIRRLVVALGLATWMFAFAIIAHLTLIFQDDDLDNVQREIRELHMEALASLIFAAVGGTITTIVAMRRFSVFVEAQVDKALELANDCQFPIVLMRAFTLLQCHALPSHEEMRSRGLLEFLDTTEIALEFFERGASSKASTDDDSRERSVLSVFFSHQWTSFTEPDPDGVQCAVICRVIGMLARQRQCACEDLYVWIDYFSIPQANVHAQKLAINSLPIYASLLHIFVVIAPEVVHRDTGLPCNKDSYQRRGWCRAEQLCHWADRGATNMYLADEHGLHHLETSLSGVRFSLLSQLVPQASDHDQDEGFICALGRRCLKLFAGQRTLCLRHLQTSEAAGPAAQPAVAEPSSFSHRAAIAERSIELSRWFAQAIYVFGGDSEFSCCRMLHTLPNGRDIPCDRTRLMLPMLGTYAKIYRRRNMGGSFALLHRWISRHRNAVFPPNITLVTKQSSTRVVPLFGDLQARLERRLDSEGTAEAAEVEATSASGRRTCRMTNADLGAGGADAPPRAEVRGSTIELQHMGAEQYPMLAVDSEFQARKSTPELQLTSAEQYPMQAADSEFPAVTV